jgi:two-component system OmpR family response regulator
MSEVDRARRVLIVDDDESIRDLVDTALSFVGFDVARAASGTDALGLIPEFVPDLVVLDVMMPGMDGFEVCRRLRADGDLTPVIFLTAKGTSADMLHAFRTGADDYLTKPFDLKLLVARVEAVLRRTTPPAASGEVDELLRFTEIELDERAHQVRRAGEPIKLSPTEFKMLRHLLLNQGRVISKAQIAQHLWQYEFGGDPTVIESHMSTLRRKLGDPRVIHTVRGVGYVLRNDA